MDGRMYCIVLVVCLFAPLTWGHLCLISPHQRGSMMGLNKPASKDCVLLQAPCGGRARGGKPLIYLPSGMNFTVVFQKNLNHYTKATPGYFSIGMAGAKEQKFKEVARVADMGEPSLHIYEVDVYLPKITEHAEMFTLQVTYVTNNKAAPPVFYQCADIGLYM